MLSEKLRPIIEPFTGGAGKVLVRAHISANMLTTVGILGAIGCGWLIAAGRPVLAGLLFIPAVIIDVLDGAAARATGTVTKWGGFFDSVGDRVADGAIIGGMAWAARDDDRVFAAALLALVLSFLVPYARAKAEAMLLTVASGPGERAERAVIIIVGLVFGLEEIALWALVVLTLITFSQRCLGPIPAVPPKGVADGFVELLSRNDRFEVRTHDLSARVVLAIGASRHAFERSHDQSLWE
ncbi:MAG TPA: CDP-alcohol phosphatidyltransferase family protein, partial [Actinomycetota bacterium]|nr:CDP-alcohol phosphatidyltransferase family protein [Actinomycetota bacterium]